MFKTYAKQLWELWVERCKTRKALRELSKQTWSIEFLTTLLVAAAKRTHQQYSMTITSPQGANVTVTTLDMPGQTTQDVDIFDFIDDDVKVKQFMDMAAKKGSK
jgi:hypothetical protein